LIACSAPWHPYPTALVNTLERYFIVIIIIVVVVVVFDK
jgi:hypothetical protein